MGSYPIRALIIGRPCSNSIKPLFLKNIYNTLCSTSIDLRRRKISIVPFQDGYQSYLQKKLQSLQVDKNLFILQSNEKNQLSIGKFSKQLHFLFIKKLFLK